jgi:hypothetical protein
MQAGHSNPSIEVDLEAELSIGVRVARSGFLFSVESWLAAVDL